MVDRFVGLLLATLAIVLIGAIVFPLFVNTGHHPPGVEMCINNIKQIATAISMYEDDYPGGVMPWSISSADTESRQYWYDLVKPYMRQMRDRYPNPHAKPLGTVFRCPRSPEGVTKLRRRTDYGYNPYLDRSVTVKKVHYPAFTLRLTETAVYDYDVHNLPRGIKDAGYRGGSLFCPMPNGRLKGSKLNPQAPGWHNGHQSVLWVDGHVSTVPWQRVMYTDNYKGTTDPNVWCRLYPKDGTTAEG